MNYYLNNHYLEDGRPYHPMEISEGMFVHFSCKESVLLNYGIYIPYLWDPRNPTSIELRKEIYNVLDKYYPNFI